LENFCVKFSFILELNSLNVIRITRIVISRGVVFFIQGIIRVSFFMKHIEISQPDINTPVVRRSIGFIIFWFSSDIGLIALVFILTEEI